MTDSDTAKMTDDLTALLNSYFHIIEKKMEALQEAYRSRDTAAVKEAYSALSDAIAVYKTAEMEGGAAGTGYFHLWYNEWAAEEIAEIRNWWRSQKTTS